MPLASRHVAVPQQPALGTSHVLIPPDISCANYNRLQRGVSHSVIGKSFPRIDAVSQVTGQSLYAEDLSRPNMLHAKALRSNHAHAKVLKVDTSEAEKLAGVKAVITSKDFPHNRFRRI